ncbi:MAG: alpha/beta hydrolase-fold protein [Gemmatimonadales bacterium]
MNCFKWLVALASISVAATDPVIAQGTSVTDSVSSPGLAANVVGDRSIRPMVIYLPPSYRNQSSRRYPVLYMLHGATSVPEEWLDGKTYQGLNLEVTLDSLMAAAVIPEMIVVMPNSDNALGASWYTNSPALGNWEDFVVQDVVRHVDSHYRTQAQRARRALFGHSMGGFGALKIGFTHPDVFGFVYASSPALIALSGPLAPSGRVWSALSAVTRWQDAPGQMRLVLAFAAALDGSRTNPRLFDELPFSAGADGIVFAHLAVRARWLARMPPDLASEMVRRGDRQPALLLEAGTEETAILDGIQVLRARLDSLRVHYADSTFTGGHIDQVRERMTHHILPAVGRWFTQDPGGAAVPRIEMGPSTGRQPAN